MKILLHVTFLLGLLIQDAGAAGGGRMFCRAFASECGYPGLNVFASCFLAFLIFACFKMMASLAPSRRAAYTGAIVIAAIAGSLLISPLLMLVAFLALFVGAMYLRQKAA